MPLMPRIDSTLALYALILSLGLGAFILIFWTMGAINLFVGQGLIHDMALGGLGRVLFLAYPFVLAICAVGAFALYAMRQNAPAIGLAGMPIAGVALFYLVLTALPPRV